MMGNYFVDFYVNMRYGLVGAVLNYVVAALVPVLLGDFNLRRPRSLLMLLAHILGCCAFMTGLCALYYLFSSVGMPQICGGVLTIVYAALFSKFRPVVRVMMSVSLFSVNANVFVVCFSISDLLQAAGTEGEQIIVVLLCLTLFAACVLFLRSFSVGRFDEVPFVSVALVSAVGFGNVIFWILTNVTVMDVALKIVIGIVLIVLLLFAYYSAYALSKNLSDSHKRRAEAIMRETDERMMRMSDENIEAMRKLRHELKNQCAYMKVLLDNREYDKLDRYFAEYSEYVSAALQGSDCGNRTINAVIGVEEGRAKRAGAALVCRAEVPPQLAIGDVDLCSLLMNMINNAVEYCERRPELADRRVDVIVRQINKTVLVEVANALLAGDGERALGLKTSKSDRDLHGYGTKIVAEIAEKYNGSVRYAADGGRFTVSVILFDPPERSENSLPEV